jgi:Caspase domain
MNLLRSAILVSVALLAGVAHGAGAPPRRVAILVGATQAPPGQVPLRYSYRDVGEMAAVLEAAGEFSPKDVHQLLDPDPASVLRALDEALASLNRSPGETLLLFYYSGHADDQALYPAGEALPMSSLKARLESGNATVRLGILDSCRGGAWTQAKGLQPGAPFPVSIPMTLTSEGSALIASSSGLESAHESEALQGSFFTHHFVAGLRGAADRTGNGEITLGEAFAYAQERTIRDSAEQTGIPQHPSFDIHLHGRQDLALTRIDGSSSMVGLTEVAGPLQIIQLQTGLVILEIPEGNGLLKLALPPGRYLVQRRDGTSTYAREISVAAGATSEVSEGSLMLVGKPELAAKGPEGAGITQEPPTQAPPSTTHRHLGFLLRLDTGPAYIFASEPYQGSSRNLSGGGWDVGLSIGGALAEDNLLAFHLFSAIALNGISSNASVSYTSVFNLNGFGPEYTHYFMPLNVYLSGAVLLTNAGLSSSQSGGSTTVSSSYNTDAGVGLKIAAGKEWWVGDHWGLGLALHYAVSWNHDPGGILGGPGTLATNAFTFAFSATYN